MTSHAHDRGIAVISTLLIALVVIGVGIGAITLNRSNLRIASNVQTGAIARLSADSALEAVVGFLTDYNDAFGTLPGNLDDAPTAITVDGTSLAFESPSYTPGTAVDGVIDSATLQVVGTGPNGARFVTDAVIELVEGDGVRTRPVGLLTNGLTGQGVISLNGAGGAEFVDGGIHGGRGFTVKGTGNLEFNVCDEDGRSTDGTCDTATTLTTDFPMTGSDETADADFTCDVPGNGYDDVCNVTESDGPGKGKGNGGGESGTTVPSSLIPDPIAAVGGDFTSDFSAARERAACSLFGACTGSTTFASLSSTCDVSFNSATTFTSTAPPSPGTVCVDGDVQFADTLDLTDVNLVVSGKVTTTSGTVTLDGTSIITFGGNVEIASDEVLDSRLLADGWLCINDLSDCEDDKKYKLDVDVKGVSTLATTESLWFGSSAELGGDLAYTGIAIITEGDVDVQSASTSWAVFLVGCNYSSSGAQNIYGGIVTDNPNDMSECGNIDFDGTLFMDSGVSVSNPDLPQEVIGPVEVVSIVRRR